MTVRGKKELVEEFCTCRHVPLHPWAFREMSSRGFHPTSTWVLTWIINRAGLPTQVLCTRRDRADGSLPEGWGHTIRGVPPHLWGPSLTLCWHQPSFMEWSAVRAAPQEGRDRWVLAGPSLGSSFSDRLLHPRCRREVPLLPLMPRNSTTHTSPDISCSPGHYYTSYDTGYSIRTSIAVIVLVLRGRVVQSISYLWKLSDISCIFPNLPIEGWIKAYPICSYLIWCHKELLFRCSQIHPLMVESPK